MYDQQAAEKDVLASLAKVNAQLPADRQVPLRAASVLTGDGGSLDSLTLISLMVEVEEAVAASSGKRIPVLDGALMHKDGPRFTTVSDLARWLAERA